MCRRSCVMIVGLCARSFEVERYGTVWLGGCGAMRVKCRVEEFNCGTADGFVSRLRRLRVMKVRYLHKTFFIREMSVVISTFFLISRECCWYTKQIALKCWLILS